MNVHNLVFRDSMTVNYNNLIKFKIFFFYFIDIDYLCMPDIRMIFVVLISE